jgi:MraZ protein
VLRGNAPAKIDDKGRLKVPNAFRALILEEYGRELFVTSVSGDSVRLYPMTVWLEIERKLAEMPTTHPARTKFLDRVNFYGQLSEVDPQGRVLIQPLLRESAQMSGEVDVLGQQNYLEVWNHDRFLARLHREPFTDADARALSEFGI